MIELVSERKYVISEDLERGHLFEEILAKEEEKVEMEKIIYKRFENDILKLELIDC